MLLIKSFIKKELEEVNEDLSEETIERYSY